METKQSLQKKIESACERMIAEQPCLLKRQLNERTITARLALHLQKEVGKEYFVDCEYSKMRREDSDRDVPKALINWPDKTRVYPDIIIHKRTPDSRNNLAVIEAKWRKGDREAENETEKVRAYIDDPNLKYQYGFILILDEPLHLIPI
jgi:hypothetical protein